MLFTLKIINITILTFGVVPFLVSTAPSSIVSAFVAPRCPPVTLTSVVTRPATRTCE